VRPCNDDMQCFRHVEMLLKLHLTALSHGRQYTAPPCTSDDSAKGSRRSSSNVSSALRPRIDFIAALRPAMTSLNSSSLKSKQSGSNKRYLTEARTENASANQNSACANDGLALAHCKADIQRCDR